MQELGAAKQTVQSNSHISEPKREVNSTMHKVVIQKDEDTIVDLLDNAQMKIFKNSVTKRTETLVSYQPNTHAVPKGYSSLPLSWTISTTPPLKTRESVEIILPVFCVPVDDREVEVTIFKRKADEWIRLEDRLLTSKGYLKLHYTSIDNVTAFLPIESQTDVEFNITLSVYRKKNGEVAVGLCVPDRRTEVELQKRLINEKFRLVSDEVDTLEAKHDNVLAIGFGEQYRKVSAEKVLDGKGYVSYHDVDSSAKELKLTIKLHEKEADNLAVPLFEKTYDISQNTVENKEQTSRQGRSFRTHVKGDVKAGIFVQGASHVKIGPGATSENDAEPQRPSSETEGIEGKLSRRGNRHSGHSSFEIDGSIEADHMLVDVGTVAINNAKANKGFKPSSKPSKKQMSVPTTVESVQEESQKDDMAVPTHRNCETEDGQRNPSGAPTRIVERLRNFVLHLDNLHLASFAIILFLAWIITRFYI